jgi:catechol 2,3-dioxygenase-like lactoylglutathione lyase family enzyme
MPDQTNPRITGVYTVGIPVTDQDRAVAFYVDSLRLDKRLDVPLKQFGGRWIEVAPPSAPVTLALVPERDGVPSGVETGIRLTTPDADAVHADLQSRGVEVGEMLRWPNTPAMFEVHDPDGNRLEIVEQA